MTTTMVACAILATVGAPALAAPLGEMSGEVRFNEPELEPEWTFDDEGVPEPSAFILSFDADLDEDFGTELLPDLPPEMTRARAGSLAFAIALREEALAYRNWSPWALQPEELANDTPVLEAREEAAEQIFEETFRTALQALFTGEAPDVGDDNFLPSATSGLRIDDSPSWRFRRRKGRSVSSIDIPLTPSSIRFSYWREFPNASRLAGALVIDPWDERAYFALTLGF